MHNTHIVFPFEYYAPMSVPEACDLLDKLDDVRILAGGTDLIPKIKEAALRPKQVVNLKKIPGLTGVEEKDGTIKIGALTKIRDVERSLLVQESANILYQAVHTIGSVQIRNLATIGGNICNASPAADSAAALIALDATVHLVGPTSVRSISFEDFFVGPGKTVLLKNEILTDIVFPTPARNSYGYYRKIGRVSLDLATTSLAVQTKMSRSRLEDVRIVAGSVAPVPLRLKSIEDWLKGQDLNPSIIGEAANRASDFIKPIDDIRGSAEYRRELIKGLTREAFETILEEEKR